MSGILLVRHGSVSCGKGLRRSAHLAYVYSSLDFKRMFFNAECVREVRPRFCIFVGTPSVRIETVTRQFVHLLILCVLVVNVRKRRFVILLLYSYYYKYTRLLVIKTMSHS